MRDDESSGSDYASAREEAIDAREFLGLGALPIIIFAIGANLSNGVSASASAMPCRTVASIVASKLVVVPAINLGLLLLFSDAAESPDAASPSAS